MAVQAKIKGISLLEVLITMVIVAIGILGIAQLQSRLIIHTDSTNQRTQALLTMEDQLDILRKTNYDTIQTTSSQPISGTPFSISWTVTPDNTYEYKTVTITVSWTDRHNQAHQVQLTSIIHKHNFTDSGRTFM